MQCHKINIHTFLKKNIIYEDIKAQNRLNLEQFNNIARLMLRED